MTEANATYFKLLKEAIAKTFLERQSAPKKMTAWKGETIALFQEDLRNETKASISEKSFYTYFKNTTEKLPRIDVLNLLCTYAGYKNWEEFKIKHSGFEVAKISEAKKAKRTAPLLGTVGLLVIVLGYFYFQQENKFIFCFIDEEEQTALKNTVRIEVLKPNESSVFLQTDTSGCFNYSSVSDQIKFVVQSPYYKTDTIVRTSTENKNSLVPLRKDDYALMLKYYSDGNLADVEKRRRQLNDLIAPKAQIYQVFNTITGIELYTKQEFINKMTIPTSALKNMHILDKEYTDGKITKLKFIIQ